MKGRKPKARIRLIRETAAGVELELEFDYGWRGRVYIPYKDPERIKREIREIYRAYKPVSPQAKLPREIDWEEEEENP